ncbi:HD domain-containing protein [Butyrivibrio sp. AE2032]|uniref:HD domain-containing protein n=1 Tax=Butyrivibrio sp. AE2032 TaxID=1458463 RepID=UPI000550A743|nr:MATE family efflux transporter [Butyrivibrio sp. AE2032]
MASRQHVQTNQMISKLYFNILPVQIMIIAMGAVNTIVDGVMAGRFIGASAVGVVGLYYPIVNIIDASGSVLLGGSAVLCGKFMGRGDIGKTEGVFSLDMALTFIAGAFLALVSLIFPGQVASLLGATDLLQHDLTTYIFGYAFGILPMLFAQQIAMFLQLERQDRRGYAGIVGMILSNILLDILLVGILNYGIFGLALATSLSNIIYFLILAPFYCTRKAQLHFGIKKILWNLTGNLLKIGFPGALVIFCIAVRGLVINRILLHYSGSDALSAMSAYNIISGVLLAFCIGNGAVVRMLVSVFAGEEDRDSIRQLFRILATKVMALSVIITLVILIISPFLAALFFPDRNAGVYHMACQLFVIYSLCIPFILICKVESNYLQAMGHNMIVNVLSVSYGLIGVVVPALILAPLMGALGVWISIPIGTIITIFLVPIYRLMQLKRLPGSMDDFLFFDPDFGVSPEDSLWIPVHDNEELAIASSMVQEFCDGHNIERRASYYSALCLEEIAGKIMECGFEEDKKKHTISALILCTDEGIVLRIKADSRPLDPKELAQIAGESEDPFDNIEIRTVYNVADDVNYQYILGLNVLTITILESNLGQLEETDFILEKTLAQQDTVLHKSFRDAVYLLQRILPRYQELYPGFTDHTVLHSMTLLDSCNRLIGTKQLEKLNRDEIYILLMAAYLHDVGMSIRDEDYEVFKDQLDSDEYFKKHPKAEKSDFIRDFHNELSGLYIDKYAELYDLPSPEYAFAIKQIARGHRKTDLYDEKEYPAAYKLPNGNTVCLPYLAALLRIADEIDVVASRNPVILYDLDMSVTEKDFRENKKLYAVKSMKTTSKAFVLSAVTEEEEVREGLKEMVGKMQKTLDYCRDVVEKRTEFVLSQKKVILNIET